MRFLVVGLGSMGRRRIRLLKQISSEFEVVGVDSAPARCEQAQRELGIETMGDLDEALAKKVPDAVVISTSPLSHAAIINKALRASCHVFTELNLVDDMYEENIRLAQEMGKVLFLSSTFLYREEIRFIQEKVGGTEGALNYNYHVGQYLPDWHPWESIQNYFVGDKRTNGCRELFAIELPWLTRVFGEVESCEVLSSKNSGLGIQYKDNYLLLVKHAGGHKGVLAVDVVSRKAVRNLEVYGENLYMTWNGTPSGLKVYDFERKEEKAINLYESVDKQEGYAAFVIENAYRNELEAFIGEIRGAGPAIYTFEDDKKVLALIGEIEAR